jgi:hypothetical protein
MRASHLSWHDSRCCDEGQQPTILSSSVNLRKHNNLSCTSKAELDLVVVYREQKASVECFALHKSLLASLPPTE